MTQDKLDACHRDVCVRRRSRETRSPGQHLIAPETQGGSIGAVRTGAEDTISGKRGGCGGPPLQPVEGDVGDQQVRVGGREQGLVEGPPQEVRVHLRWRNGFRSN